MRRSFVAAAACVLAGVVVIQPTAAPAAPDGGAAETARAALAAGLQVADKAGSGQQPAGPNPFLALLANPSKADYAGWSTVLDRRGAARGAKLGARRAAAPVPSPLLADEDEPADTRGSNDTPANGQRIAGFGTGKAQNPRLRILGSLSPEVVTPQTMSPNAEDDGSIPLAGATNVGLTRGGILTTAQIGDGPHGKAGFGTGDFDFYTFNVDAGDTVTLDIDTPVGLLDSVVAVYSGDGTRLALNDDGAGSGLDSLLRYRFSTAGTFYGMVSGYRSQPADPMDPASGPGAGSEGAYDLTLTVTQDDLDFYAVQLRQGDVLGASSKGSAAWLAIHDSTGGEVHGSAQDASALYPAKSPLPGGGRSVTEHVIDKAGWYHVGVFDGAGSYDVTVEVYRPYLQGKRPVQTLFLDFDGARVNTGIWGGPGVRQLSPMPAFLARWGLTRADEDAVIDAVVARAEENLRQDMIASGLNGRFRLRLLNSRDHTDPWGDANVSRIVIGGTVDESGVDTIGIAQSIDPGNFDTEETALVLLDTLSDATGSASLNTYLEPVSDRIGFIGQAVGNVISHEAGHVFGDWHVDQFNDTADLMDQGGNFPVLFGVGADGIGGTADDPDVDFGHDDFNPTEGFTGVENTLGRIVSGVTS